MLPTRFTDRISVGGSLRVSPICLGVAGGPEVVLEAFKAGINFFFLTADMHWPIYEGLRQGIRLLLESGVPREDFVVAGTSYVTQPEFTSTPFREAADSIPGLGAVDILVSGGSYESDISEAGRIPKFKSRIGAVADSHHPKASGASFHSRGAALDAINQEILDIAFIRYNTLHNGASSDIFPHLKSNRKAKVFCFKSTAGFVPHSVLERIGVTSWRPGITDYYRHVLSEPNIDGLLCSLRHPEHIGELQEAISRPPMSPEEMHYMVQLSHAYHGKLKLPKE